MTALSAAPAARLAMPLNEEGPTSARSADPAPPLPRTKLVERLISLPSGSVAVMVAPAGYGKSALLAEWATRDTRPFAGVRLSAGDDDPAQLVRSIARALATIPALRPAVGSCEDSGGKRATKALTRRVTAVVAEADTAFVLVVDDVHVLRRRETHAALADLIEAIGPKVRVALASP